MKLVSFRIKGCFGFKDSDRIDLQDPTNLIYILGRNSSGKTSFLTALAHFAPHKQPESYANFANFDASSEESFLLAEYDLETGDFNSESFIKAFSEEFIKAFQAEIDTRNQKSNALLVSKEYQRYKDELTKRLRTLYTTLSDSLAAERKCLVKRNAAGNYLFSAEPDFKDTHVRKKQLSEFMVDLLPQLGIQVNSNGQLNINGSWQQFTQISADNIENSACKTVTTDYLVSGSICSS